MSGLSQVHQEILREAKRWQNLMAVVPVLEKAGSLEAYIDELSAVIADLEKQKKKLAGEVTKARGVADKEIDTISEKAEAAKVALEQEVTKANEALAAADQHAVKIVADANVIAKKIVADAEASAKRVSQEVSAKDQAEQKSMQQSLKSLRDKLADAEAALAAKQKATNDAETRLEVITAEIARLKAQFAGA